MARRPPRTAAALAALLALAFHDPASPAARVDLYGGDLEGDGWRAQRVSLWTELDPDGQLRAGMEIGRLLLPTGTVEGLRAECPRVEFAAGAIRCPALRVETGDLPGDLPTLTGSARYDHATGGLAWTLAGGNPGRGSLRVEGRVENGPWSVTVAAESLSLSGGNATGTVAFEDLVVSGRVEARGGEALEVGGHLSVASGEAYFEPVYADFSDHALTLELDGRRVGDSLALEHIRYRQDGVLSGAGSATLASSSDAWTLADARLELEEIHLPGAYRVLFQPFLATTVLGSLDTTGNASGTIGFAGGKLAALSLELSQVYLDDEQNRLALYGLSGALGWRAAGDRPPVELTWDGGYVYGIPFGASHLRLEPDAGGWALAGPVQVPVLDGAFRVDRLEIGELEGDRTSAAIEARVLPLGMRGLARALDWPPLSGTLSGEIPAISYRDGVLTLGGELTARVFDGEVRVGDLRIEDLFRPNARLYADVEMAGLDLERVTEAFSFGLITGRLDGHLRQLAMIDWSPVAFDARLYTPPDDSSRHRISQRAVDNIASLGGGGTNPLAGTFLRFFEDFSYRRMALGCRLQDDVCHMSGLEAAENGYRILQGSGLPRIEIIGHARRVSWPTLIAQLKAIIESEGPVIE